MTTEAHESALCRYGHDALTATGSCRRCGVQMTMPEKNSEHPMTYPAITEGLRVQYRKHPDDHWMHRLNGLVRVVGTINQDGYRDILDEDGEVADTRANFAMQPGPFWRDFEPIPDDTEQEEKTLRQFKGNGVWRDENGHMWVPIEAVSEAVQVVLDMQQKDES